MNFVLLRWSILPRSCLYIEFSVNVQIDRGDRTRIADRSRYPHRNVG